MAEFSQLSEAALRANIKYFNRTAQYELASANYQVLIDRTWKTRTLEAVEDGKRALAQRMKGEGE